MHSRFLLRTALLVGLMAASLPAAEPAAPATGTSPGVAAVAAALQGTGLTPEKLLSGLKSGLGSAVKGVSTALSQPDALKLDVPSSMSKLAALLEKSNQGGALDGFKSSLSQVAASVAPQATATLKESIAALKLDDATAVAKGEPGSATAMLRSAAEPILRARLLPLVSQAIASNGTAMKAKDLAAKAGPFASFLGVPSASDLEGYVVNQVIDTSFSYLGKEEAALRADPSKLKNSLAAKVFGLGSTETK